MFASLYHFFQQTHLLSFWVFQSLNISNIARRTILAEGVFSITLIVRLEFERITCGVFLGKWVIPHHQISQVIQVLVIWSRGDLSEWDRSLVIL